MTYSREYSTYWQQTVSIRGLVASLRRGIHKDTTYSDDENKGSDDGRGEDEDTPRWNIYLGALFGCALHDVYGWPQGCGASPDDVGNHVGRWKTEEVVTKETVKSKKKVMWGKESTKKGMC